jgi:hypothetical protein
MLLSVGDIGRRTITGKHLVQFIFFKVALKPCIKELGFSPGLIILLILVLRLRLW